MREVQVQEEIFGKADNVGGASKNPVGAATLLKQLKSKRDDSAAKNIVQMKTLSLAAFV